jgi:hypothetical protein
MMILAANEEVPISPKNSVLKGDLITPTTQTQWGKIYSTYDDATNFWGVHNFNNFGNITHYPLYGCLLWQH